MQTKENDSVENITRHKIQEAEYFLSKMKQFFEDDNTFAYNLSAFLSAARSITWYMQKQYKQRDGFAEWYCPHQIKMSADSELEYLNKVRVEDVHRKPVLSGATRELTMTGDIILVKDGASVAEQAKEAEPKPPTQSRQKTVRRWFPEFRQVEVIEFCENQLTKLAKMVEECENRFP